jgi:hypothetical protein
MPEVSYTELEFGTATDSGLDRLVFRTPDMTAHLDAAAWQ